MTLLNRINFDMRVAAYGREYPHRMEAIQFAAMQDQIAQQWETNTLLRSANAIAAHNHVQLRAIDTSLSEILDESRRTGDLIERTNTLLEEQNNILSDIRRGQESQLTQVRRERALKEVLFQIDKCLTTATSHKDSIAAGYTAELLLSVVDRHRLGTHDLGDIDDKRQFDSLMETAKGILRNLTHEKQNELVQFRSVYAAFGLRMKEGPLEPDLKMIEVPQWQGADAPPPPTGPASAPTPPSIPKPEGPGVDLPAMTQEDAEQAAIEKISSKEAKDGKSLTSEGVLNKRCDRLLWMIWVGLTCSIWFVYLPIVMFVCAAVEAVGLRSISVVLFVLAFFGGVPFAYYYVVTYLKSIATTLNIELSKQWGGLGCASVAVPWAGVIVLGLIGLALEATVLPRSWAADHRVTGVIMVVLGAAWCIMCVAIGIQAIQSVKADAEDEYLSERRRILNLNKTKAVIERLMESPLKRYTRECEEAEAQYATDVRKWHEHQTQLEQWRKDVAKWKAEENARRSQHDTEVTNAVANNEGVQSKTNEYRKAFDDAIHTLRRMINDYLDDHVPLQAFFSKV